MQALFPVFVKKPGPRATEVWSQVSNLEQGCFSAATIHVLTADSKSLHRNNGLLLRKSTQQWRGEQAQSLERELFWGINCEILWYFTSSASPAPWSWAQAPRQRVSDRAWRCRAMQPVSLALLPAACRATSLTASAAQVPPARCQEQKHWCLLRVFPKGTQLGGKAHTRLTWCQGWEMLLWCNGARTVLLTWLCARAPAHISVQESTRLPPCPVGAMQHATPHCTAKHTRARPSGAITQEWAMGKSAQKCGYSSRTAFQNNFTQHRNTQKWTEENVEKVEAELSRAWLLGPAALLPPFHSLFLKLTQKRVEKGKNGRWRGAGKITWQEKGRKKRLEKTGL